MNSAILLDMEGKEAAKTAALPIFPTSRNPALFWLDFLFFRCIYIHQSCDRAVIDSSHLSHVYHFPTLLAFSQTQGGSM